MVYRIVCPLVILDYESLDEERAPCAGRLEIRSTSEPKRLLARGSVRLGRWSNRRLDVRMTAAGRLASARPGGTLAVVRFGSRWRAREAWQFERWIIRLQR